MNKILDEYKALVGVEGTKVERRKLLELMTHEELDILIKQAGNNSARLFYSSFK